MEKCLVTGATGFVGASLAGALAADGAAVRALVRRSSSADRLRRVGAEIFEGDLEDPASLRGAADGVEVVYHAACALAGTFDARRDAREMFQRVNVQGTAAIAREALRAGVRRFVHVSSTAAMGTPREEGVDERSECRPRTPYQVSKRQAELELLSLHRDSGLDVAIVRPCLVAGPGKRGGELVKLFRLARRGLVPVPGGRVGLHKPMIAVGDLVGALRLAAANGRAGEIYLVHDDAGHTMADILDVVARLVGRKRAWFPVPIVAARAAAAAFEAIRRLVPSFEPPLTRERLDLLLMDRRIDVSKARRELGFAPAERDLERMLGDTYRWHVGAGDL